MQEVMVPCKKCGNKVPASSLKLDIDEKMVICPECVKSKKIHKEIQEEVFHKKEENNAHEESVKKVAHKCTSCGYKFRINPETKVPRNCPYCNARVLSF
ncbi:hypothetical protein HYX02_07345 [Candidatus Woesearchaeota archaeon]|nr:hypothetical protein [Candidatus Woesearchaeota archaeon]